MTRWADVAAALVVALVVRTAAAAPTRFAGPHPVAERAGGGYCSIEAAHLHGYAPDHAVFYQPTARGLRFIGDPSPFGYTGERSIYYGHHPVASDDAGGTVFCFIDGPHYHGAPPPHGDDYALVDGVAFYVGPLPVAYVDARARRWKAVNDAMLPFARFRPTVNVVPPAGWSGRIYIPPGVKVKLPQRPARGQRRRVHVEVREGGE